MHIVNAHKKKKRQIIILLHKKMLNKGRIQIGLSQECSQKQFWKEVQYALKTCCIQHPRISYYQSVVHPHYI